MRVFFLLIAFLFAGGVLAQGEAQQPPAQGPQAERERQQTERAPARQMFDRPGVKGPHLPDHTTRDVAITGELSITGNVRAVGGIVEKMYAARQAGMRLAIVPRENERDIDRTLGDMEIVAVRNVREAFDALELARPRRSTR